MAKNPVVDDHEARRRTPRARRRRLPPALTVGDLTIDPAAQAVSVAGRAVALPPRAFDLLYALAAEAGCVISADKLLAQVWGPEYRGEPQVIYVHIRWLREKLEADPQHPRRIVTTRGVGYKLEPQAAPEVDDAMLGPMRED